MADIFPKAKALLRAWLVAYRAALDDHGTEVGLTSAEVTATQGEIDGWLAAFDAIQPAKNGWQTATANCDTLTDSLIGGRLRKQASRIKDSTAYTPALGQTFGIIAPVSVFNPATFKTTLKPLVEGSRIILDFLKGETEGVRIYTRLRGELGWTFLAYDTHAPYYDTRPLAVAGHAETREYMARGVVDDQEIGLDSDIVSVVFSG